MTPELTPVGASCWYEPYLSPQKNNVVDSDASQEKSRHDTRNALSNHDQTIGKMVTQGNEGKTSVGTPSCCAENHSSLQNPNSEVVSQNASPLHSTQDRYAPTNTAASDSYTESTSRLAIPLQSQTDRYAILNNSWSETSSLAPASPPPLATGMSDISSLSDDGEYSMGTFNTSNDDMYYFEGEGSIARFKKFDSDSSDDDRSVLSDSSCAVLLRYLKCIPGGFGSQPRALHGTINDFFVATDSENGYSKGRQKEGRVKQLMRSLSYLDFNDTVCFAK